MADQAERSGTIGERLVSESFGKHCSSQFSFPNPKTKREAEVADVLIWWNRVAFLIEVKTRDGGGKTAEAWARTKVNDGVEQVRRNHQRLKDREPVFLHNQFYNVALQYEGLEHVYGIVVLLSDEPLFFSPKEVVPDLYEHDVPVHVFSWDDLKQMVQEIDTIPDLAYYLEDRLALLKRGIDIPVGRELHALGSYKMGNNSFGQEVPDFGKRDLWAEYQEAFADDIRRRALDNRHAELFDHIAAFLPSVRKLHVGLPTGLYFAWEFGALPRRMRALYGKKLKSVEDWFSQPKMARKFAIFNPGTGNWTVFFFSKQDPYDLLQRLMHLVELKLVKEVHNNQFSYGVYGIGFQVSQLLPPRFQLVAATFNEADSVKGYTPERLQEAYREFGNEPPTVSKIEEFPR
jgi:hypothetical protein